MCAVTHFKCVNYSKIAAVGLITPSVSSGLTGLSSVPQGYILNFASSATKKITESVAETASTIKKTVEEGNLDGIIDKVGIYSPRVVKGRERKTETRC